MSIPPVEQAGDLPLVGAVERDVDRAVLFLEESADDLPDDRDPGVVHHRADFERAIHQNTSNPHSARPMKSYA